MLQVLWLQGHLGFEACRTWAATTKSRGIHGYLPATNRGFGAGFRVLAG